VASVLKTSERRTENSSTWVWSTSVFSSGVSPSGRERRLKPKVTYWGSRITTRPCSDLGMARTMSIEASPAGSKRKRLGCTAPSIFLLNKRSSRYRMELVFPLPVPPTMRAWKRMSLVSRS